MIRHSLHLLVFSAAVALAAGGEAAAGSCCNCPAPCVVEPVVEVVEAHAAGAVLRRRSGPDLYRSRHHCFPTVRKMYQSIGDYPYIGYGHGGYHHRVAMSM